MHNNPQPESTHGARRHHLSSVAAPFRRMLGAEGGASGQAPRLPDRRRSRRLRF
jgi:hypothetical protein